MIQRQIWAFFWLVVLCVPLPFPPVGLALPGVEPETWHMVVIGK